MLLRNSDSLAPIAEGSRGSHPARPSYLITAVVLRAEGELLEAEQYQTDNTGTVSSLSLAQLNLSSLQRYHFE